MRTRSPIPNWDRAAEQVEGTSIRKWSR
jgi:hypothetical protein